MTEDERNHLIQEWALATATVVLTRRDDLKVYDPGIERELGLDFHVRIDRGEDWPAPSFGVIARATVAPVSVDQANESLSATVGLFSDLRRSTRPSLALLSSMRGDQSFFCWIDEPSRFDGGEWTLGHHRVPDCRPLTEHLLSRVVDQIVAWWDAVEPTKERARAGRP